jgi:large subunit ribosomal protein L35
VPKQKTRSSAKKRFKVTANGKLMARQAGIRHNFENMTGSKKRRKRALVSVDDAHARALKRTMGLR